MRIELELFVSRQMRCLIEELPEEPIYSFLDKIQKKYYGNKIFEFKHYKNTDDQIHELIVDNRLVATVIHRRDDFNYDELTFLAWREKKEQKEKEARKKAFESD